MAKRRAASQRVREAESVPAEPVAVDDTALQMLTDEERAALGMDSWEPSLLRAMLQAENRLPPKKR